ncbi:3-dehydroquinate synthase [Candidatus Microgenomates bacterium]|nr:3-dehydroquinate synthase [Candidatus Microgenomates bacterium]
MRSISIKTKNHTCPVLIDCEAVEDFAWKNVQTSRVAIITEKTPRKFFGKELEKTLKKNKIPYDFLEIKGGESAKVLKTIEDLANQMLVKGYDRDCLVISLGGGVVGDIAGFLAATYKRGVKLIHIPTTFLAMVDSSLGGKNGVNLPQGKNMLGTIYQPVAVLINLEYLVKLPEREWRNGFAEVIKYGMIWDEKLFCFLEKHILTRDQKDLEYIVSEAVKVKKSIVERDEHEENLRKILNYGHTIGHAIEIASGHAISHGEAVAIGMSIEGKMAVERGILRAGDYERQNKLLVAFRLPTEYAGDLSRLLDIAKGDKKNKGGQISFIFPEKIGKANLHSLDK